MFPIDWKLSHTSEESWDALYADCVAAQKTIDLEIYIFEVDAIGKHFLDLFKDKAKQGIKIRLLFDMVGSYYLFASKIPDELRALGIEVRFFNRAYIFRFNKFIENFFRTHRKVVTIDGSIVHLGGVNIAQGMRHWRDTNIRFTGALVEQAIYSFDHMWKMAGKKRFNRFRPFIKSPFFVRDFALRTNSPHRHQRFIYRELLEKIRTARTHIYLTTPYFIPDFIFFRAVRKAARRGVDVRLLVPESSDHTIVDLATQSHFNSLLKAGVKIYRYTKTMLHAKTVSIDDTWATLGSFNLDNVSFLFNYEVNLVTEQTALVTALTTDFMNDVQGIEPLKKEYWAGRSWIRKIGEFMTWPIHQLL